MNKATLLNSAGLILLLLLETGLYGQQRTHLPYSIFGVGELSSKGFGRNLAMGKSGIALSSTQFLNNLNPASNSLIDSISFFFDLGLNGEYVSYRTNYLKQYGQDYNIKNMALGFRISRRWASSVGVTPFSDVGYKINTWDYVEGSSGKYSIELTGTGGLSQFYWDNSFSLFKNFTAGVNLTYLFGNIKSTETVVPAQLNYGLIYKKTSYLYKVFADLGFQYSLRLKDNLVLGIGGIFGKNHKLNFKQEIEITDTEELELRYEENEGYFDFPMYAGGGLALTLSDKLTFSGDYIFTNWAGTKSDNKYYRYKNTNKYRFGVEYIPGLNQMTTYLGTIHYRAGYYFEDSYLVVENKPTHDRGLTLGVGLPFFRNKSSVNVSFYRGTRGTLEKGLIKEDYTGVFVSLELHDWWFLKAQYE